MGKFLRIFFGCHARPDRSFFFYGKQFPICARCTGELIGILAGICIVIFYGYPRFFMIPLLMLPMVLDGFLQLLTPYKSGNIRRVVTGFLFGIAFVFLLIYFHIICVNIAGNIVKLFIEDSQKVDEVIKKFLP